MYSLQELDNLIGDIDVDHFIMTKKANLTAPEMELLEVQGVGEDRKLVFKVGDKVYRKAIYTSNWDDGESWDFGDSWSSSSIGGSSSWDGALVEVEQVVETITVYKDKI